MSKQEPILIITDATEQKIFNPWNPVNKVIPDSDIIKILKEYGVNEIPKKMDLFRKACVHKSYVDRPEGPPLPAGADSVIVAPRPENCLPLRDEDNEELEFEGDSLLGSVIASYLRERYPKQGEGFLTRLRSRLANNEHLGELAKKIGFQKWLIISRHVEEMCGGRSNRRILGSMIESWMGALFLDKVDESRGLAYERCYTWLIELLETHVDFTALIAEDTNFKDQLLKYYQSNFHTPPRYSDVSAEGPLHDRIFTVGVLHPFNDSVICTSINRNKKVAQQEASRLALIHFGVLK